MTKNVKKKGFTLIELIAVIAILGILAAIAVPQLSSIQTKAKIAADKATFDTISRNISIGVAAETITENVTVTSAENTGIITTSPSGLIENGAAFKLSDNIHKTFTWTVSNGVVTPPVIDAETGVIGGGAAE